jgi:hypothetical protein
MRWLGLLLTLAVAGAPCPVLAQHHGGSHSDRSPHSHGGSRSHSYTPRGYSSSRPYRHRSYAGAHYQFPGPTPRRLTRLDLPERMGRRRQELVTGTAGSSGARKAKRQFERQTGHPHGWPGHVIDHKVPLACGGADSPSNMQGQTTAEAKAKDQVERRGCR